MIKVLRILAGIFFLTFWCIKGTIIVAMESSSDLEEDISDSEEQSDESDHMSPPSAKSAQSIWKQKYKKKKTLISRSNSLGLPPLYAAARSFVRAGVIDEDQKTILHHVVITDNSLGWIEQVIRDNPALCYMRDKDGQTPLDLAVLCGNKHAIKVLLKQEVETLEKVVANLLLKEGNINAVIDEKKNTVLHLAAAHGYIEVVKALLQKKAKINARARNGITPLHMAVRNNQIKIIKLLLEHGAKVDARDNYGKTALHIAAFYGYRDTVEKLIEKEAQIDIQDLEGRTSLYIATQRRNENVVEVLIKKNADVNICDINGRTPLQIAQEYEYSNIVLILHGEATKAN
jgi:ankyrin repeat protein